MSGKLKPHSQMMVISQDQQTIIIAPDETPVITFRKEGELSSVAMAINALRSKCSIVQLATQNIDLLKTAPSPQRSVSEIQERIERTIQSLQQSDESILCTRKTHDQIVGVVVFEIARTLKRGP